MKLHHSRVFDPTAASRCCRSVAVYSTGPHGKTISKVKLMQQAFAVSYPAPVPAQSQFKNSHSHVDTPAQPRPSSPPSAFSPISLTHSKLHLHYAVSVVRISSTPSRSVHPRTHKSTGGACAVDI